MIRIVDEETLLKHTKKKVPPSLDKKVADDDLSLMRSELEFLRGEVRKRDIELRDLRAKADVETQEARSDAMIDVLKREVETKDEEIARMKDRHVKDVEIIARLHDTIDDLEARLKDAERSGMRPPIHETISTMEQLRPAPPDPPIDDIPEPLPAEEDSEVERYRLSAEDFEPADDVYDDDGGEDIPAAVVIPIEDSDGTGPKKITYRPLK